MKEEIAVVHDEFEALKNKLSYYEYKNELIEGEL